MQTLKEFWSSVRLVSTPLIVIESHDEIATTKNLLDYCNEREQDMIAVWSWDCAQGYRTINEIAAQFEPGLSEIEQVEDALLELGKPERVPVRAVVVFQWRAEFWTSPQARQALV